MVQSAVVPIFIATTRKKYGGGFESLSHDVVSNANNLAYHFAQRVEAGAKKKVHVRTGHLRDSIVRIRLGPGHHVVRVGAFYGIYVEYGTRYMHPRVYFRPAIADAYAAFKVESKKVFKPGAIKETIHI